MVVVTIGMTGATCCAENSDSAGAGGKEPAGTVLSFLTVYSGRQHHL